MGPAAHTLPPHASLKLAWQIPKMPHITHSFSHARGRACPPVPSLLLGRLVIRSHRQKGRKDTVQVLSPGCARGDAASTVRTSGQARGEVHRLEQGPSCPSIPAGAPDTPCLHQKDHPLSPTQVPDPQTLRLKRTVAILNH